MVKRETEKWKGGNIYDLDTCVLQSFLSKPSWSLYGLWILEGVCMRPEMKSSWKEISFCHEKKFSLNMFLLRVKWSKILCLYEKSACADGSFRRISCRGSVYITFTTRNEISFQSNIPQWNNSRNMFHFGVFHVNN